LSDDGSQLEEAELGEHAIGETQQGLATGIYSLSNVHSNKCLDTAGGGTGNGTNIQQWTCNSGEVNQRFMIYNHGGNSHTIWSLKANKVFDADISGNGSNVHLWQDWDGGNQRWQINSVGGGMYELRPTHDTTQCLDLKGWSTTNGANIETWNCGGQNNQRFWIYGVGGSGWVQDFWDGFDSYNTSNWQDEQVWVNNEDQCYVPNNEWGTREVSNGTIKFRVVDTGDPNRNCNNWDKFGAKHPNTRYVAGRIMSKNRKEFIGGRWKARARMNRTAGSGENLFPAIWMLGYRNNEGQDASGHENVCWAAVNSGEIDFFEHHSQGGGNQNGFVGRGIKNMGGCDNGDWWTYEAHPTTNLTGWHDYEVEYSGSNLLFKVDGGTYASYPIANDYPEPMFAILNYAKFGGPLYGTAELEVDYIEHFRRN
jgi:hypothetical protein